MTLREQARTASVVVLPLVFGVALHLAAAPQHPATFHATADLVVVDVTVLARDTPIRGLAASEFHVSDNGEPQTVDLAAASEVPLDVSLVVDASASVAIDSERLGALIRALTALLRTGDRVGLLTFGSATDQLLPLSPMPIVLPPIPIAAGRSAVFDALMRAIICPGAPGRRHVIVELTDGGDNVSVSAPDQLLAAAQRSDAAIDIVLTKHGAGSAQVLASVAHVTGGELMGSGDVIDAFKKILASLQDSYVLTYVPHGVTRTGWHTITVNVERPGSFVVRARRGYFGG